MIVYDTTLKRLKAAFEHYASPAGDLPIEVQVIQKLANPGEMRIRVIYPDRDEELVLS